jgi:uncharacterized protein YcbK (DUF882 family)
MVFETPAQLSGAAPRPSQGCGRSRLSSLWSAAVVGFGLFLAVSASPALARHSSHGRGAQSEREHPKKKKKTGAAGAVASSGPTIRLEHLTTRDSLTLRPGGGRGGFSGGAMKSVSRVLRCHHTGKRHAISPRLVSVLYATARHFHSSNIYVVAGYRAPVVARKKGNPKSAHKRGVACDFRLDGVGIEAIRDYLRATYHNVGVGYYPNSGFIHVDVGRSHSAYWIDYSRPGEKARYAKGESATGEERDDERPAPGAKAEAPPAVAEVAAESGG